MFDILWFVVTPISVLASCDILPCVSVSVSSFFSLLFFSPSLLIRTQVLLDSGPTLLQYNLILANYICHEALSKLSHILRFQGGQDFWADTIQAHTHPYIDTSSKTQFQVIRHRPHATHAPCRQCDALRRPRFQSLSCLELNDLGKSTPPCCASSRT